MLIVHINSPYLNSLLLLLFKTRSVTAGSYKINSLNSKLLSVLSPITDAENLKIPRREGPDPTAVH